MTVPLEPWSGGLVWKRRRWWRVLLVVHRPRRDGWALPKGRLELGESLENAARRQLCETTAIDAKPVRIAGAIHYHDGGRNEIAVFWHMLPQSETDFVAHEEVDKVEWLTRKAALERLADPRERDLLQAAPAPSPLALPRLGQDTRPVAVTRWWRRLLDPSADRLAAVRRAAELELDEGVRREDTPDWRPALAAADDASASNMTDAAWLCLKLAHRLRLLSVDEDELEVKASALRYEAAEKLSGWRAATVSELLSQAGSRELPGAEAGKTDKPAPSRLERRRRLVYEAARIRDEATDNQYRRLALVRRNRTVLLPVLALAIALLGVLTVTGAARFGAEPVSENAGFLAAVAVFGALGGALSAIQSLGAGLNQRIPEAIGSATLTLMRPAAGAAAALGAFIIVRAGFLKLDVSSGYVLLAFAFAAGFSERFIFRLVGTATTKK